MLGLGIHLLSVLVLAVLVEILCRLGRFRPALCHALWLVVLVKLLVPPVVAWPLEVLDVLAYFQTADDLGDLPDAVAGTSVARLSFSDGAPSEKSAGTLVDSRSDLPAGMGRVIGMVALAAWLLGAALMLLRLTSRARQARRMVAAGNPAPSWLADQLQETCARLGVAAPGAVVVTAGCGSVYVHFMGRPVLVISDKSLTHLDAAQWRTILTHEMAHLKRRDHWVAWLMLVASVVWWWNPCLWWVRHRIHLHSELACDTWVVNTHPDERRNYAETMVQVLAMLSEHSEPAPVLGLAVWSSASQERRLWMIMKGTGVNTVGRFYAAGLVALALVASPAWITTAEPEPVVVKKTPASLSPWQFPTAPSADLEDRLKIHVDHLEFKDAHLSEVFAIIREQYNVNLVMDQRALIPLPVSGEPTGSFFDENGEIISDGLIPYINLRDASLGEFLKAICRPLGLRISLYGNVVWASTPKLLEADAAALPPSHSPDTEVTDQLEKSINIEFENVHLKDAMELIQDRVGIHVVMDRRVVKPKAGDGKLELDGTLGYVTDGIIGHLELNEVTAGEAVYAIVRQLGLSFSVEEGFIYIASPELVASDPFRQSPLTENDVSIRVDRPVR